MDRLDGQLVFLLITFVVWVFSSIAERKRKQQQSREPTHQRGEQRGEPRSEPSARHAPRVPPPPAQTLPQRPVLLPRSPGPPEANFPDEEDTVTAAPLDVLRPRSLPSETLLGFGQTALPAFEFSTGRSKVLSIHAPPMTALVRRGGRARQRLGLSSISGRQALRRAVLWREVLGPPRALRGPYRSPVTERAIERALR